MTVESAKNKSGPFLVAGTSITCPRDFLIIDEDHLRVVRVRSGIEDDLTTGIGHTGIGSTSGTVVISEGVAPGDSIYLLRSVPNLQRSDYSAQGRVRTDQVESDFDLVEMQIQDLAERISRSLVLGVGAEVTGAEAMAAALLAPEYATQAQEAALEASSMVPSMTFLLTSPRSYPIGAIVRTRKEGYALEVVGVGDDPDIASPGAFFRALPDADGFVHLEQYGAVPDGNRLTGAGTDNTTAIRRAFATDHHIKMGLGFYRVTEPIFNLKEFRHVKGQGMGGVNGPPGQRAKFKPNSCLLATGTPTKRVITRRKYRASASDPNDTPMAAVLENWGGGSEFYDFSIECYCDYTDNSPTNYGADWDVGFYNGCRGEVSTTRMSVMGYFNRASFYWDVTDDFGIPQLLDPEGNPIPAANDGSDDEWTVRSSGADWCRMSYCSCMGGSIGVALLGVDASRTGDPYYDFITDQTYSDGRGKSGSSDFRIENCQIRSVQHHSAHRRFDPAGMTHAAMNATPDEETGAALYIDGWQSSGDAPSGGIRGFTMAGGRVESWEPFRVRLGQVNDVLFTDRVWNEVGAWGLHAPLYATDGVTVVTPTDYENFTYGHFTTNEYSGLVYWEYSTGASMFNDWVYDWEYTIVRDKQGRVRSIDQGFINAPVGTNIDIPLSKFRPGGHISISTGGIGNNIPLSQASAFLLFDVGGTPSLTSVGSLGANVQIITADTVPSDANVTDGRLGIAAMGDGRLILRNRLAAGETIIAWRVL